MERIISIIGIIAIIGLLFYNKDKSRKDMLLKGFKVSIITCLVLLVIFPLVLIILIVVEDNELRLLRLSQMGVWELIEMFISVPFRICCLVIISLEENALIQIIVFGLCLGILFIVRKKKLIKSGINKS